MPRHYDDDDRGARSSSHGGRYSRDSSGDDAEYTRSAYVTPAGNYAAYEPRASNPEFDRTAALQMSPAHYRPHSVPPLSSRSIESRRDNSRSPSPDRGRGGSSREHLSKSKHALDNAFSTSNSGIGIGVIGAIVGGLAAHEASEAAVRAHDRQGHHSRHQDRTTLISTIVGAAVGGLGANAIEKRVEKHRHRRSDNRSGDRSGDRGLDASRSPNPSSSRSRSRSSRSYSQTHSRRSSRSRSSRSRSSRNRSVERYHGGAADNYYDNSRSHDGDYDRTVSTRRGDVEYR